MKKLLTIVLALFSINAFAQNVGINTTTPAYPLTVVKDGIGLSQESPDGLVKIGFYTSAGAYLQTHTNNNLNFATNNGPSQMTLTTTGNIGIGTSTPKFPLTFPDAVGDKISLWGGNTSSSNPHYGIGIQGGLMQLYTNSSVADIAFGYGNSNSFTESVRVFGSGGIQSQGPNAAFWFKDRTLNTYSGWSLYANNGSANLFKFGLGDAFTIDPSGNVGIGTTTPGSKLEVNGTFKLTDGTQASGKVLTTDGSGNASWQVQNSGFKNIAMFNIAGTTTNWTVPAGVTNIYVEMWGGGGNGSTSATSAPYTGGGGGGGGYAAFYLDVLPAGTVSVTVANGGNASTAFSIIDYSGITVFANNGLNGIGGGAGHGGTVNYSPASFNLKYVYGENGTFNFIRNFTIPAGFPNPGTYTEYRGGKGGNAFNGGTGSEGQIFLTQTGSFITGVGDGKFPGGGGGGYMGGSNIFSAGASGLVLIYY